jgi:hypothetical protein
MRREENFDRSFGAQDGRWLLAQDLPPAVSQGCGSFRGT